MSTRRLAAFLLIAVAIASAAPAPGPADPVAAVAVGQERAERRPRPPEVTCGACVVVADTGRVLFGRGGAERRPNASTTKMITALVVTGEEELDEVVTVSPGAAATGGGGLDLQAGDTFSVHDLLYALMLTSSNDAAVALAEHVAGSHAEFVVRMNSVAGSLGATGTEFVTAHGLDVAGHYSTARDLARFGAAVLEDPILAGIVATPRAVITGPNGPIEVENRNLLLESYAKAVGIKTGYTRGAGNVLVAAARRRGRTVIAVAMGSADATEDARRLLDYGFARLARTLLLRAGTRIGALVLPDGGSTPVVAGDDVRALEDPVRVAVAFEPVDASGPVDAGEPVGTITVTAGRRRVATVAAVAAGSLPSTARAWPTGVLETILRTAARATGQI